MPALTIRIKKNTDGSTAFSCTRPDGSSTWQKQLGRQARFFPRHDLTHYAVETVLGYRRGFYGLVAEGWELSDFGTPWPRGPLPADADPAELLVGFLDGDRAAGRESTAAELVAEAARHREQHGGVTPLALTDDQLARIRATMRELFARWDAVPEGEALSLRFDVA